MVSKIIHALLMWPEKYSHASPCFLRAWESKRSMGNHDLPINSMLFPMFLTPGKTHNNYHIDLAPTKTWFCTANYHADLPILFALDLAVTFNYVSIQLWHNFRIPLHTTMTSCSHGYSYGSRIPCSKRNVSGKVELNSIDEHNFRILDHTKDH